MLTYSLIFTNDMSKANIVKWKVSKMGIKKFRPWESLSVCVSVSLCVCQSVHLSALCLSSLVKKFNNFWWNERILMKFSGPDQLRKGNFCAGVSDKLASRLQPWAENSLFLENITSMSFYLTVTWHIFLETPGLGLKKWGTKFEFSGRAWNIGVWTGGYWSEFFRIFAF